MHNHDDETSKSDTLLNNPQTSFYTPIKEAKKLLSERSNDLDLKAKVEAYIGTKIFYPLCDNPKAVLVRSVITPDNELGHFLKLVSDNDLPYSLLEYSHDKFSAENDCKYTLAKMYFHMGKSKKNNDIVQSLKVVDFQNINGKDISEIKTLWKTNLTDFHHEILKRAYPSLGNNVYEISNWLKNFGSSSSIFYKKYLALFLCHGILFENFHLTGEDNEFTVNVFLPAFQEIERIFGIKPLIVPIEEAGSENDISWVCHPKEVYDITTQYITELKNGI